MEIRGIVKDAIRYPFSDWRKILILGIIIVISDITGIAKVFGPNIVVIWLLGTIGFFIGFLVNGYMFRIVKSSLDDKMELPEFNDWADMFKEGIKIFIVFIVYLIPAFLAVLFFVTASPILVEPIGLNLDVHFLVSEIWPGILTLIASSFDLAYEAPTGIFGLIIGMLYMIIIIPIFLVAIANMAYYEGEFSSAFRFREILDEISSIGWNNLIKWYIMTGILFLILFITIDTAIAYIFSLIHLNIVGEVLISLIVTPYLYMYIARSVALFYMPD